MNNSAALRKIIIRITTILLAIFFSFNVTKSAHSQETAYSASMPTLDGSDGAGIVDTGTVLPDLFTGTFEYSIPIKVPDGRKGIQPQLALTYRSNRGNGLVGVGWDLEIATIERSTRTGVDYADDAYILRMNGATIDLVNIGSDEYREKIQHAFYRIKKIDHVGLLYMRQWGQLFTREALGSILLYF